MKAHNSNCSIKHIPIEFASCTCGITNTMTFKHIEKEFDEYCLSASHTLGESLASVQVYNHRKSDALMLKSFLKQSFIKYLNGEVVAM